MNKVIRSILTLFTSCKHRHQWVIPEKRHPPPDGWQVFLTPPPLLNGFPRPPEPPSHPDFHFFRGPKWKQQAMEKTKQFLLHD